MIELLIVFVICYSEKNEVSYQTKTFDFLLYLIHGSQ